MAVGPWAALMSGLYSGRRAVFYSITARRLTHPEEFKAPTWPLYLTCFATAPSTPWSSIDCPWRPRVKSMSVA
jgi:hypothetical protein